MNSWNSSRVSFPSWSASFSSNTAWTFNENQQRYKPIYWKFFWVNLSFHVMSNGFAKFLLPASLSNFSKLWAFPLLWCIRHDFCQILWMLNQLLLLFRRMILFWKGSSGQALQEILPYLSPYDVRITFYNESKTGTAK